MRRRYHRSTVLAIDDLAGYKLIQPHIWANRGFSKTERMTDH